MLSKLKKLKRDINKIRQASRKIFASPDRQLFQDVERLQANHPNPFVKYGQKCFSQNDEDGLVIEIIKRLKIEDGSFAEFGCGTGIQNNSLILLAMNWRGFWVGGQDLLIDITKSKRLAFFKSWITRENIVNTYQQGIKQLDIKDIDLISLDLDGNDLYFVEELLSNGATPKIFIVEYNAKFPPPVKFTIDYDPNHIWNSDDYEGASLSSFAELFKQFGYTLICCNAATGVNAFFVKNEYAKLFPEVPKDIEDIYSKPYYFEFRKYGHNPSNKTIELIVNR